MMFPETVDTNLAKLRRAYNQAMSDGDYVYAAELVREIAVYEIEAYRES